MVRQVEGSHQIKYRQCPACRLSTPQIIHQQTSVSLSPLLPHSSSSCEALYPDLPPLASSGSAAGCGGGWRSRGGRRWCRTRHTGSESPATTLHSSSSRVKRRSHWNRPQLAFYTTSTFLWATHVQSSSIGVTTRRSTRPDSVPRHCLVPGSVFS